jgi:hypothetical protein
MTILQDLEGAGVTIENTNFSVDTSMSAGTWRVNDRLRDGAAEGLELTKGAVTSAMACVRPPEDVNPLRIAVSPDLRERLRDIVEALEANARRTDEPADHRTDQEIAAEKSLRANLTASSGWRSIAALPGVESMVIGNREDGLRGIAVLVNVSDSFEGTLPHFLPALGAAIPIYRLPNVTPAEANRALGGHPSLEERTCEAIQHALSLAKLIQRNPFAKQTPPGDAEELGAPSRENDRVIIKLEEALMWADTDESIKLHSLPAWIRGDRPIVKS